MAYIRSQNGEILEDLRKFVIREQEGRFLLGSRLSIHKWPSFFRRRILSSYAYLNLGQFSTKETALAELDRLERWIDAGAQGVYQVSKED